MVGLFISFCIMIMTFMFLLTFHVDSIFKIIVL